MTLETEEPAYDNYFAREQPQICWWLEHGERYFNMQKLWRLSGQQLMDGYIDRISRPYVGGVNPELYAMQDRYRALSSRLYLLQHLISAADMKTVDDAKYLRGDFDNDKWHAVLRDTAGLSQSLHATAINDAKERIRVANIVTHSPLPDLPHDHNMLNHVLSTLDRRMEQCLALRQMGDLHAQGIKLDKLSLCDRRNLSLNPRFVAQQPYTYLKQSFFDHDARRTIFIGYEPADPERGALEILDAVPEAVERVHRYLDTAYFPAPEDDRQRMGQHAREYCRQLISEIEDLLPQVAQDVESSYQWIGTGKLLCQSEPEPQQSQPEVLAFADVHSVKGDASRPHRYGKTGEVLPFPLQR